MVALSALVSGLDEEMLRLGYKDSTMVWYRGCWRRLQRYFAAREAEEFSLDLAMAWVEEACGFFAKERAGTLKQTDVYLFRVAQMLGDYEAHGAVLRRYSRTVSKLAPVEAAVVARFEAWLRAAGRSASTVRSYGTLAAEFAAFAGTRGGLAGCDAGTVGAFAATLAGPAQEQLRLTRPRGSDQVVAGNRRPAHVGLMPSRSLQRLPPRSPPRRRDRSAPCRARRPAGRAGSRHRHRLRICRTTRRNILLKPALSASCRRQHDRKSERLPRPPMPHHAESGRPGRCQAPGHPESCRVCPHPPQTLSLPGFPD
jgi:hypothetical protein